MHPGPRPCPERCPRACQYCYLVRMARWSPSCQSFHTDTPGSCSCQDASPLAGWLFQGDGTVNLSGCEEPRSYKQVGAPPTGHSLSLASSPLPQEAGPTSISRNLWQGSRAHRWSTPFRPGASELQKQQGGETGLSSSGRKNQEAGSPEAEGLRQGRGRTVAPAAQPQPEPGEPLREEG